MSEASRVHVPGMVHASSLACQNHLAMWNCEALAGRLVELSSEDGSAQLTLAVGLAAEAQRHGDPVAWVTKEQSVFFPPDAVEHGVDLESLVVVRITDAQTVPRAAEMLVRSGTFGLVVVDLGRDASIFPPLLSRLMKLAQHRNTTVLFLTIKAAEVPSLGSLVSLRGEARYTRAAADSFACELRILKDKHGPPTWTHREDCRGPMGVR